MKIELRNWKIIDFIRYLGLTLNKKYSGEFSRNFFGYLFFGIRNIFRKKKDYKLAVIVNGKFAGSVALYRLKKDYELGYFILREFRNKGVATKASKKMMDFGFKELKLKKITSTSDFDNIASNKILRKLGFKIKKTDKKNKEFVWEKIK